MSATGRDSHRIPQDLYETPVSCASAILRQINFARVHSCFEPCAASGRIYSRLPKPKYYAEISEGVDYLAHNWPKVDLVITNPPFSLALEFLNKSFEHADSIIYLLRLNYLGTKKRKSWWRAHRPTHLYVLSQRPSFVYSGNDATEYAWFVWCRGKNIMKQRPGIYVL